VVLHGGEASTKAPGTCLEVPADFAPVRAGRPPCHHRTELSARGLAGSNRPGAAIDETTTDQGPRLAFHQFPEGKSVKNRLQLDLVTTAAVAS